MKYFLIDEIAPKDMEKVEAFFKENAIQSEMERLFWVRIPQEHLSDVQASHEECRPHVFAVELGNDFVKCEFFIRTMKSLHCECQGYFTDSLRAYLFEYIENMIKDLGIRT